MQDLTHGRVYPPPEAVRRRTRVHQERRRVRRGRLSAGTRVIVHAWAWARVTSGNNRGIHPSKQLAMCENKMDPANFSHTSTHARGDYCRSRCTSAPPQLVSMIGPVSSPTQSYWLAHLSPQLLPTPSLAPPEVVDIAIIGAGMTGSALAYWLSVLAPGSEQKSIAILDARGVAGGATGRNGGHLWPNPASDFEAEQTAELLKFISDFDVDCDLTLDGAAAFERAQPESGVEYADTPDDPENANQEEDWGDDLLTWDAARCSEAVGTDSFSHATYYPKAAQFYPAKVAAALRLQATCAPVRVLSMDLSSPKGATDWHSGRAADGAQVAVCTNGWAADLL